jgi:LAO/AO transport system kinase
VSEDPHSRSEETSASVAAVQRGDARTCGRLISRIESGDESVVPILQALYGLGGLTPIIGITGPPGSGKSTLTGHLITRLRAKGLRVAVLAVDPSSPFSGGAILGDRVRMSRHNSDPGVFIRSMASRGRLGGLATAAGDALTVLDAMKFDRILIETVGVGQTEIDIMHYAHSVVILQTPGTGDIVQSIKAGILEIADIFVLNKADLPGVERAVSALQEAVEFRDTSQRWRTPVVETKSTDGSGVDELLLKIEEHIAYLREHSSQRTERLRSQVRARLLDLIHQGLRKRMLDERDPIREFSSLAESILERRIDPHGAAVQLIERLSR